ncbi:MAG: hypothetical protein BGO12_16930 [Verrucomicrobia bacterium 61-8]|nr:hypothetical protein [Verrucomicrobiota bacterium]OJV09499.1 MAG: hypothetical protein BGO12_16930 [Verrucomicrobia bacterium 61-8]
MTPKEQLNLLAIFHYVVGGLHALFGSFGLIHFTIGLCMLFGGFGSMSQTHPGSEPPAFIGLFFAIFGAVFVLFGWTLGALTILSGRKIAQRRARKFSVVMGAINCAMFPFGTTLGVFTLILLNRREADLEYGALPASA